MKPEEVRREALRLRKALPQDEIQARSLKIAERFLQSARELGIRWKGRKICFYKALPGEIDLTELERRLEREGIHPHYPRVVDRAAKRIEMAGAHPDEAVRWETGAYGIREPASEHPAARPEDLDLIIVPAVAFGESGERVGMGAGFYDRFLPQASRALRVGLGYDLQLFAGIEQASWDQPVHWIVTETREIRLPGLEGLLSFLK